MALFQHSVLNQYLQGIDTAELNIAWAKFKDYFLNIAIQENINAQKEEQFQEGFLRELFVKILGYTINPEPNFNLTTELKNVKGGKKVDGAIVDGIAVLAVIELKGTNVTDLNKVEEQAFNYILPPKGIASKYLIALLNSRVISFFLKMIANTSGMGTTRWINVYVKDFPIPVINSNDQQPVILKADTMLTLTKALQQHTKQFLQLLFSKYPALNTSTKLQAWHTLTFADFAKELAKHKIQLSLSEQSEWLQFFEQEKQKALHIKSQIDATDKEIDKMVYALYGLTAEEISIVEKG